MNNKYTLTRNGATVDLSGTPIFCEHDGLTEVAVHQHPQFGNILFIDGEAQISQLDYEVYHQAMLAFVRKGSRILVIGDGDGGFCGRTDYTIVQVEMSAVVRKAATIGFDVEWPAVTNARHSVFSMTLAQYLALTNERKDGKYDAIFLAITDDFNADLGNMAELLELWSSKLKPGGVMVSQVGCLLDPDYPVYDTNHRLFEKVLTDRGAIANVLESRPYIPVFHSQHVFRALYKVAE